MAAIAGEAKLDGKWLLRTSADSLTPTDLALAYKQLLEVERGWWDMKGLTGLRPVFHQRGDRIRSHIQFSWLGLPLVRVVENGTGDTWRNVRDQMHLVTRRPPKDGWPSGQRRPLVRPRSSGPSTSQSPVASSISSFQHRPRSPRPTDRVVTRPENLAAPLSPGQPLLLG